MNVKEPIIFAIGVALGSVITFAVLNKKLDNKHKALYEKELESVRQAFAAYSESAKEKAEASKNKPSLDIYTKALDMARKQELDESSIKNIEVDAHKIDYSNFQGEDFEETDSDEPEVDNSTLVEPGTDMTKPYILKRMPSPNERPYYTPINIVYYVDGTYADTHGSEMEIEEYIGKAMMDYVEHTEKDEIFIRNDELGIDIDITKSDRTYDEIMFG